MPITCPFDSSIQITDHDPSFRAQMIARRTYQRPIEGTDKFETWNEVAARVRRHQQWLWERAKKAPLTAEENSELDIFQWLVENRVAFPAGRTLWLGGTDVAQTREAAMLNCFTLDTEVVTTTGVRPLSSIAHGEEVSVFDHNGDVRRATGVRAGVQPVSTITLGYGRHRAEVKATPSHEWLLASGERTRELKVGDVLASAPVRAFDYDSASFEQQLYWAYGFAFGDGSYTEANKRCLVRLCGHKARFISRFTNLGFPSSQPLSCGGDFITSVGGYQKVLPDITKDDHTLVHAFVDGWLSADGERDRNNAHKPGMRRFTSIQITGAHTIAWARKALPAAGWFILNEQQVSSTTNYGERSDSTVVFSITDRNMLSLRVQSIESAGEAEVGCLEVEESHSFLLPGGIVTGNCSHTYAATVHDIVDIYWLLLQGAGVGFQPVRGALSGFSRKLDVTVIRSTRTKGDGIVGRPDNHETIKDGVWRISVGDSAEAWAKLIGKILTGKHSANKLVVDFREVRGAGERLGRYGWISSGDAQLAKSVAKICGILNERADQLLTRIDIMDIVNLLGETLSSRRSAQITLVPADDIEADAFAMAKKGCYDLDSDFSHRGQSNNSLLISRKPTKGELRGFFATMVDAGGSEPGFINTVAATKRAPWFAGLNPCAEQLLANGGVCNLSEIVLPRVHGFGSLMIILEVIARANYRATLINLDDGILQRRWHEINEHLHLCGVGLTGIDQWLSKFSDPRVAASTLTDMRHLARDAAVRQARELGLATPKHVSTVKPSGTLSKVADCTEGGHQAIGPKVINTIMLSAHDPLVAKLKRANYTVYNHPHLLESVLVEVPVHMPGATSKPLTAIEQMERYKLLMVNWCDANCSITISYDQSEVRDIVEWLYENWDVFVGVSFMPRVDATKSAEELGYSYLPQRIIDEAAFDAYAASLLPIDLDDDDSNELVDAGAECAGGVCPVR